MRTLRVRFPNGRGAALAGSLDLPGGEEPRAYAIFAHCFTCNRNYKFIRQLSRVLAPRGIAVLRFDFTGLGDSGGAFEETNFTTNVEDLLAAARFLDGEYRAPALLIGHSLGGTAVLAAAARLPKVKAVVTINAPFEPSHVLDRLGLGADTARPVPADVEIGGQSYRLTPQLIEDLRAVRPGADIDALDAGLLVLHAPGDRTAGIEHAGRIFAAARHPKSFVALPDADHLLTGERDAGYAGEVIASWSAIYLGTGE